MISQIVGIDEGCDQSGDRVSKYDKSCLIFSVKPLGLRDHMQHS